MTCGRGSTITTPCRNTKGSATLPSSIHGQASESTSGCTTSPSALGSVVNQFNRLPQLKSTVLMRNIAMLVCHYVDDELLVDFNITASSTQRPSHRLNAMWDTTYTEEKIQVMSTCTYFLGSACGWSGWLAYIAVTCVVKPTTRAKATALLKDHLQRLVMSPA